MGCYWRQLIVGYERRKAADPSFPTKSCIEVMVAASTQSAAEWSQRGGFRRMLPEMDFVVAGVLTAIAGKYYSMWKVAQTASVAVGVVSNDDDSVSTKPKIIEELQQPREEQDNDENDDDARIFNMKVPTNAFQRTMMDGCTRPTLGQRAGSFLAPAGSLFRAGMISGFLGYGLTYVLICFRSIVNPNYVPVTRNVNVLHASLYTGTFMATVSNIRYQLLQGVVEPFLQQQQHNKVPPSLTLILIFTVRIANGLLGSILAIAGMRRLGLQQLK